MIGEELVPGLPETRRPDQRPLGDAEAVAAELVVSAERRLVVCKYEGAEGPAPAAVARVLELPAGELGPGAKPGDVVVLYSESLGDAARFRRLLGRGRRARFRVWSRRRCWSGRCRSCGSSAAIRSSWGPRGRREPSCGDQLIGVGGVRGRAPGGEAKRRRTWLHCGRVRLDGAGHGRRRSPGRLGRA